MRMQLCSKHPFSSVHSIFILINPAAQPKQEYSLSKKHHNQITGERSEQMCLHFDFQVTKLVLTVVTVFIFCWLPHWVTQASRIIIIIIIFIIIIILYHVTQVSKSPLLFIFTRNHRIFPGPPHQNTVCHATNINPLLNSQHPSPSFTMKEILLYSINLPPIPWKILSK